MECINPLTTVSVWQTCHSAQLPSQFPFPSVKADSWWPWPMTQFSVFCSAWKLGWKDDVKPKAIFFFWCDIIGAASSTKHSAFQNVILKGDTHFQYTSEFVPRIGCRLGTQSALWAELGSDTQRNLRQRSTTTTHTPGDRAPGAQRKTIKDMKTRKWMGAGKVPKKDG